MRDMREDWVLNFEMGYMKDKLRYILNFIGWEIKVVSDCNLNHTLSSARDRQEV